MRTLKLSILICMAACLCYGSSNLNINKVKETEPSYNEIFHSEQLTNDSQYDLEYRVSELEDEVGRLKNDIDDLEYELRKLARRVSNLE